MHAPDLLLVQPPWGSATCPSLGLHVLKAHLEATRDANVHIRYLNMDFYERLPDAFSFELLLEYFWEDPCLFWLSESFFAPFADESEVLDTHLERLESYIRGILQTGVSSHLPASLSAWLAGNAQLIKETIRDVVPAFLAETARELVDERPGAIGFTAFFNQTMASLALARSIKRLDPELPCLLGGASITGECALAISRLYPQMDFVIAGEGEFAVGEILDHLQHGAPSPAGVFRPGQHGHAVSDGRRIDISDILTRPAIHADSFPPIRTQPFNCFNAFLDRRETSRYHGNLFYIPFEVSRGCYWMYKSKCTFCGIADNFPFRIKSADHLVNEFENLLLSTDSAYFVCVDNALPKSILRKAIPRISEIVHKAGRDVSFFFEMRVDFDRADLETLAGLGNLVVQPGIESFSTEILAHMRKGTTKLQNIRFLRWCRELSIVPYYNVLFGFPGECDADYDGVAEEMRSLFHLGAPRTVTKVMILRDSPLWREATHIEDMRPWPEYDLLLPHSDTETQSLFAYYFTGNVTGADGEPVRWRGDLVEAGTAWKAADEQRTTFLVHERQPDGRLVVYDGRGDGGADAPPLRFSFQAPFAADAFNLAGDILSVDELCSGLMQLGYLDLSREDVDAFVILCIERRLFAHESGRFTRLTIPLEEGSQADRAGA